MPTYQTTEHPVSELHLFTTDNRIVSVLPAVTHTMERQEGQRPNRFVRSLVMSVLIVEEIDDLPE